MPLLDALAIVFAGMAAGAINAMVGSGTLITFPTLLFLGYPPLVANVSNNIGLVAGGFGSIHGYRKELEGQGALIKRLVPASFLGSITGALLLLALPESAFKAIVPALILLALVLVITGPRIQRWAAANTAEPAVPAVDAVAPAPAPAGLPSGPWQAQALVGGVFCAGVYGGYFGAAQGVLLLGIMSALLAEPLQRINGFKNVLGTTVNAVAAVVFVIVAWDRIDWSVAGLIALGALAGGVLGARLGRRLPPNALRGVIVVVGALAIVNLLR
ncbi:MAG: sulfite exporter TauE/SafE family protein [Solirubrobacteraceae bacterium]|nr:sulfite exporter TauE/SafE family protein [Solirubrobacteraceae bacterium]